MQTQQEEIWKDIPGYEGKYQASNLGRVKSLIFKKGKCEKIMNQREHRGGYLKISIYNDLKAKTFMVHQLIAMAFLNHKPNNHVLVVNHIDFNKKNNKVSNLEIITSRENTNKKHLNSKSEYTGVSFDKSTKKWKSRININKKEVFLGLFTSEKEASEYYENALKSITNNTTINIKKPNFTSKYRCVYFDNKIKKFRSIIYINNKKTYNGTSNTERGAAILRDKKIIALGLDQKLLQILKPIKNE